MTLDCKIWTQKGYFPQNRGTNRGKTGFGTSLNEISGWKSTTYLLLIVARPGFEPRQTEPKSVVLPLYYQAISLSERKNKEFIIDAKFYKQLD